VKRTVAFCAAVLLVSIAGWCDVDHAAFWASDPVGPDEVAMVFGHGLDAADGVKVGRTPDSVVRAVDAFDAAPLSMLISTVDAETLDQGPRCVKFIVPPELKPGVFLYQIGQVTGHLNRPRIEWAQGDHGHAASPGGWLRVFGRCLESAGGDTQLALVPAENGKPVAGATPIVLQAESGTEWAARFDVPADMAPGPYCLSVHNGSGGPSGWSWDASNAPLTVMIAASEPWPDRVFNVRDFGAAGEGTSEDEFAIKQALKAAEQAGGGVVFLPRGQYMLTDTLRIPPFITLRGEKREWVSIFWPDTETPLPDGQVVGTDHFALEELTFYCSNYTHVIVGGLGRESGGNIRLERIRVRGDIFRGHLKQEEVAERFRVFMRQSTGGGDTVRMGGPNLVIRDCDLYGSGRSIWLRQADGAVVENNTIYQGRWGWYSFDGCDGLVFENNAMTGADLMSTGGGINCLSSPYSRNVYYAGNRLKLMHGWDREAMTTDAGGTAYYGTVKSCDGTQLVLAEPGDWSRGFIGAGVFILDGRGMGQHRRIVSYEEDRCTMDRPWLVDPDEDSTITVTMLHENYLFIGNEFEDAGIGLQYYGTSINNIASGNKSTRAGGFYSSGRWYHGYQPSWYCQFLGNEILEGNCYRFGPDNASGAGLSFVGSWGLQRAPNPAPLSLCSVHRGNRLHNNAKIDLRGRSKANPGLAHAIVENNWIANSRIGIYQDPGCVGVVVRGNEFENVEYEAFDNEGIARMRRERLKAYIGKQEPIAHWDFETDSPERVDNVAGGGFTAAAIGAPLLAEGVKGKGASFDGESYYAAVGTEILNLESFTLSAWVKPDDVKGRWGVIAKRTGNVASPYVLSIDGGRIAFDGTDVAGGWTFNFQSPSVVKAGQWQHVALVMNQDSGIVAYYNGQPVAQKALPEDGLCANMMRVTIGFEAWGGANRDPGGRGWFVGMIDEVKLWGRALSDEEIAEEYALSGAGNE